VGFGVPVAVEIIQVREITKIYSFIMSLFFFLVSFQLFVTGFVTSAVHRLKEEVLNAVRRNRKINEKR
jgi:hypothetical protein